ncbi:MAG: fibrobacter succinogenes major paralogous domain-containing protein [Prevotellaceae bacterium]|nr:fibrobacter succinogenes major paralogous domain-containing protein [Prevotellaceae bacterium]
MRLQHFVETCRAASLLAAMFLAPLGVNAQVTIGSGNVPSEWSLLDIDTSVQKKGLHSPRLDNDEREGLIPSGTANEPAQGTLIFNTETKCLEYWNSKEWVSLCEGDEPPAPPVTEIPDGTGVDTWANIPWVGAFWRNSQTGERVIRSTNNGSAWSVSVDKNCKSWVVVDNVRGSNATLWTAAPDDAELYQLAYGKSELDGGSGDILFRLGLKSKNPNPATPRYGTLTLTVGTNTYKLFIRQGEEADYVFRKTDPATGTTTTRPLAVKFSPYNLTDPNLTEETPALGVQTAYRGGVFVDFPTQAGAFWQWGTDLTGGGNPELLRHAYHPTKPTAAIAGWDDDYIYPAANDTWNEFTGANRLETCPSGWRRPMVGDTISNHSNQAASGNELMQSLFKVTFDGASSNTNSTNDRYFGYYADGFFDRRPIEKAVGASSREKSVVSGNTKDAAYIGLLFTNPATNASLFTPAGGYRNYRDGSLSNAGYDGCFWSSSAFSSHRGWYLNVLSSNANQSYNYHPNGFTVRCVPEL